uniref:protein-serine/threonine phosphatase n=1 Tax=Haptolina brevifila TaxID=156173 RepID=A0A7S2HP53_9EUKA
MKDMPEGFLLSSGGSDAFEALATAELVPADAENKLHHKKLYLVLDLDETLVYSKRMEDPMATPAGHKIFVRGQPFDMVLRPGLQHFLRMAVSNYIVFLYTMGDEDYTRAVLRIIDPESNFFRGGICCWRQSESRHHKSLTRVVCDRRMALIVDDSIDVWSEDLSNLCLTRRFVGDKLDDGLQLLCGQLFGLHREFFANAPSEGWSYEAAASGTLRAAPRVQSVLHTQRGQLLAGCTIALTGVVTDQKEDTLEQQPLCVLIKHYGGELTLSVDAATHLVARRKEGWQKSPKINRALQRQQAGATGFYVVWDHWLLDTLATWQKQNEESYAVRLDDERGDSPPPTSLFSQQLEGVAKAITADVENLETVSDLVPPRKRLREEGVAFEQVVTH